MRPRAPPPQAKSLGQVGEQLKQIADSHRARAKGPELNRKASRYLFGITNKVNGGGALSPKEIAVLEKLSKNADLHPNLVQRAGELLAKSKPPAVGRTDAERVEPLAVPAASVAKPKPPRLMLKPPNTGVTPWASTRKASTQHVVPQHQRRNASPAPSLTPDRTSAPQDPDQLALTSLARVEARVSQLEGFAKQGTLRSEHRSQLDAVRGDLLQAFAAFEKATPTQQKQLRDRVRCARDALNRIEGSFEVRRQAPLARTQSGPPFARRSIAPEAATATSEGLAALEAARSTQARAEASLLNARTPAELKAVRREFGAAVRDAKKAEEQLQGAANELVPMLNAAVASWRRSGKEPRDAASIRELHNVARAALSVASAARVELETASRGVTERIEAMDLGRRAKELLGTKDPGDELAAYYTDRRKVELESVSDPIDNLERRLEALRGGSVSALEADLAKRLLKLQHGDD